MKKSIMFFVSILALGGCSLSSSNNSVVESDSTAMPENTYRIDTPYGLDDFKNETIAPEIYSIVATRATNKMLDNTNSIYDKQGEKRIYVTKTKLEDDLPNGFYLSQEVTKKIIESSRTFTVVNNMNDADYYTETLIKKIQIEGRDAPIVQYKLMLFDKQNNKINEWSETIRQVENDDRSWW
ncbi:MAG: hypothetical protein ACK5N8_03525 [Alphaproteobacteria bacterium]